jgi:hypothetical protein
VRYGILKQYIGVGFNNLPPFGICTFDDSNSLK